MSGLLLVRNCVPTATPFYADLYERKEDIPMHAKRSTTGIKILLTFIALVGLGLNLFIVFDAGNGYFGVIKSPTAAAEPTDKPDLEPAPPRRSPPT